MAWQAIVSTHKSNQMFYWHTWFTSFYIKYIWYNINNIIQCCIHLGHISLRVVQESLVKLWIQPNFYIGHCTLFVSVCVAPFMLIKLFNNINGAAHTGTTTAVFQQCSGGESMIFQWGGGGVNVGLFMPHPGCITSHPPPPPPMAMRKFCWCSVWDIYLYSMERLSIQGGGGGGIFFMNY